MKDIFLTGPKHSGKTSSGKALASLCACIFIDLDELVEQRTGKTPRALYIEGADVFKEAEAESLASLFNCAAKEKFRVIAAGGGIIDNAEALAIMKKSSGILVYLEISANTAWERITANSGGELPPFLRTANPKETHRTLHERRSAAYRQLAEIVIDCKEKTSAEIAKEIFDKACNL
jgi:shikimate kinase